MPIGSIEVMTKQRESNGSRRFGARGIWQVALGIITVIAIVTELRKPEGERTWHGKVGDLVPYDFRKPTPARIKETYWNPDGAILSGKLWGVGWAPNFGALYRLLRRSA